MTTRLTSAQLFLCRQTSGRWATPPKCAWATFWATWRCRGLLAFPFSFVLWQSLHRSFALATIPIRLNLMLREQTFGKLASRLTMSRLKGRTTSDFLPWPEMLLVWSLPIPKIIILKSQSKTCRQPWHPPRDFLHGDCGIFLSFFL